MKMVTFRRKNKHIEGERDENYQKWKMYHEMKVIDKLRRSAHKSKWNDKTCKQILCSKAFRIDSITQ